jgi:uncharacterized protein
VQEMKIYGVSFDMVGKQPIVLLKTADGKRFLPIWIGASEASAIMARLQGTEAPRPMTHDLLRNVVDELGGTIVRIAVTELRDNTFYAQIVLQANGDEHEIDSRPSDAIALAVRADAPIFADEAVIEESAVEAERPPSEQQVVEDFRRFLDELSPDDFLRDE